METRPFGPLGTVSALTLGGGGLGQVWGATSREEAVATVRAAVDAGITLLDVAPGYGRGEAEHVVGEAFGGQLPAGVRVGTKVMLGDPGPGQVVTRIDATLTRSLAAMHLDRVDVLYLHSNIVPDGYVQPRFPEVATKLATPWTRYVEEVVPAFAALVAVGRIGAWGITGIGLPRTVVAAIEADPAPAVVQCVANLLDSAGGIYVHEEEYRPRDLVAAAATRGCGVLGIRAVQAGALTDAIDRPLRADDPDLRDYERAEPFRALCASLGTSPAALAHRYALTMPGIDTVVLGVKNRIELAECVAAEAAGPLDPHLVAQIDAVVTR